MRLIDADALKEGKFHSNESWTSVEQVSWQWGWNDAIDAIIIATPTVDAVEVVRCKDCKHFSKYLSEEKADGVCWHNNADFEVTCNHFCSWGEKKMRLIDADELEKKLDNHWNTDDDQEFCNKTVWRCLREAPTIDAIVRCKDCQFYTTINYIKGKFCIKHSQLGDDFVFHCDEDDYCSWGKRK